MSRDVILGIDLGTTFSAMAWVDDEGTTSVIPSAEGGLVTPSVLYFPESDPEACVVGDAAQRMVFADPDHVVRFFKRAMGRDDASFEVHGAPRTPQELSALLLRKLRTDAERHLGRPVTEAVITVPAYFDSAQRGATQEAGALAGLEVRSIVNEPTAAAIAWGVARLGGDRRVLIFDLGGGTFDITLMEMHGSSLTTLGAEGNAELGGKDWDARLADFVAERILEQTGTDPRNDPALLRTLVDHAVAAKLQLTARPRTVVSLPIGGSVVTVPVTREDFEGATADLLRQCGDTCALLLHNAGCTWDDVDDVVPAGGSSRMPMVRAMLRRLSGKAPARGLDPDTCVAIGAAQCAILRHQSDHPAVGRWRSALAGTREEPLEEDPPTTTGEETAPPRDTPATGTAERLPVTEQVFHDELPSATPDAEPVHEALVPPPATVETDPPTDGPLRADFDARPDPTGRGERGTSTPLAIRDASSHALGAIALDAQDRERVLRILDQATPLPAERRVRMAYAWDRMVSVTLDVTEGAGERRDEVRLIGTVTLDGLKPRPRGTPIDVVYRYGTDGTLEVLLLDVQTGKETRARITLRGQLDATRFEDARARVAATQLR
jgi:molecular chaperone DnaK (HSP70)